MAQCPIPLQTHSCPTHGGGTHSKGIERHPPTASPHTSHVPPALLLRLAWTPAPALLRMGPQAGEPPQHPEPRRCGVPGGCRGGVGAVGSAARSVCVRFPCLFGSSRSRAKSFPSPRHPFLPALPAPVLGTSASRDPALWDPSLLPAMRQAGGCLHPPGGRAWHHPPAPPEGGKGTAGCKQGPRPRGVKAGDCGHIPAWSWMQPPCPCSSRLDCRCMDEGPSPPCQSLPLPPPPPPPLLWSALAG